MDAIDLMYHENPLTQAATLGTVGQRQTNYALSRQVFPQKIILAKRNCSLKRYSYVLEGKKFACAAARLKRWSSALEYFITEDDTPPDTLR
ncbi:hypothetical protein TNCV_4801351 [Trichonephila clavipes]|nr:hypothetical protein TNCV_4801351 [Trichonephila clavipes]